MRSRSPIQRSMSLVVAVLIGVLAEWIVIAGLANKAGGSPASAYVVGVVGTALLWALYWLPVIVAAARYRRSSGPIFIITLFLGWTIIGWIIALAMAAGGATEPDPAPQQP
jgi:vacuolar-type H+-ATPase subunit I/STV1